MYIPVLKKQVFRENVFIERALPSKGTLSAKVGQKVEPFNRLGMAKVSYTHYDLGCKIIFARAKGPGSYIYAGKKIGRCGLKTITAPFDGYIVKEGKQFIFKQEERDYWLLAGVWGEIVDIIKDTSILIKTQTIDLHLTAHTNTNIDGELIVFPNPSDILEMQYLENFTKDVYGKIIYVGDFATTKFVARAAELGVGGILAGGTDKNTFNLAKEKGMFLGVFTGFGYEHIPNYIYEVLKDVSNRFVFLSGDTGLLRIPTTIEYFTSQKKEQNPSAFRQVEKGLKVQVLQKPYFGWIGEIDSISGASIFVKFEEKNDLVEIKVPNLLAID